jgi:hypothetical protein
MRGVVPQPPGDARQRFAALRQDAIDVRVFERDPPGLNARRAKRLERLGEAWSPAEIGEGRPNHEIILP